MKRYEIGQSRFVVVKNNKDSPTITIVDNGTNKSAEFTFKRWVQFTRVSIPLIDEALQQVQAGRDVRLRTHMGGKWFASVTRGYACVDLRQFYWHPLVGERPTKTGIALRLHEWTKLKEVLTEIHTKNPTLYKTPMCSEALDHQNQEGAMNCLECNPFQFDPG